MHLARQEARFDWLAELSGAAALAAAAGYAAFKAAPSLGFAAPTAMMAAGFGGFAIGALAMRSVTPAPRQLPIGDFPVVDVEAAAQLPPLVLDTVYEEPLLLEQLADEEPLLLDQLAEDDETLLLDELAEDDTALLLVDTLQKAEPDSRVVRLFAHQPMPTPGQLKDRIDRHLAGAPRHPSPPMPAPDASQALYAALDELKRSLR